jgi:hypothetical protein
MISRNHGVSYAPSVVPLVPLKNFFPMFKETVEKLEKFVLTAEDFNSEISQNPKQVAVSISSNP